MKVFVLILMAGFLSFGADPQKSSDYVLGESTTTYKISHALKSIDGTSTKAEGKTRCDAQKKCEFLIVVPAKSFDSGNSNRDSHMLQTVRGIVNPDVIVRGQGIEYKEGTQKIPVQIIFGGNTATVDSVEVKVTNVEKGFSVETQFDILLSKFAIERPSLLSFSIQDAVNIKFRGTFKAQ